MNLQERLEKINDFDLKKIELDSKGKLERESFTKEIIKNYLNFEPKIKELSIESPSKAVELINYLETFLGIPVSQNTIQTLEEGWLIPNVSYNGRVEDQILGNKLLETKTQGNHIKHAKKVGENDFHIVDLPRQYAILENLVNNKDQGSAKEAINFVKESMFNHYLINSTSVNYKSNGVDQVLHKLENIKKEVSAVGPDERIKDSKTGLYYQALFGQDDLGKIKNTYKEINGKELYSWRLNKKPKNDTEKVVWSDAGSYVSYVYASGNSSSERHSFGVKASQTKSISP